MINEIQQSFLDIFKSIESNRMQYSPSEWAEKYRTLTSDVSTLTGRFKYNITPYLREIVDTLSPYHPAKIIAVMKGAQIGFSEGVIINGILWMIANAPGNCLMLSANDELNKEMVESRLDSGLDSCGIRHLIRPNTIRKRNQRTGDTSKSKEYAGGRLFLGGLQSVDKLSRQRSIKYGFFDDWEAAPISDKEQGNIFDLLQQRFSTAAKTMKQYYISTPEERPSNIEKVYQKGDQRKWMLPCPKCGVYIEIIWHKTIEGESVGVHFEKDDMGNLIESSVGYICQECGNFFKESNKYEMNLNGKWEPTAKPSRAGFYSYHISCLVSAPHMYSWTDYAYKWLDIYKDGIEKKSSLKVFINQVIGQPWEDRKQNIEAKKLQQNKRDYMPGVVPNELSKKDGNGSIVLLTCACDLNGTMDDARLDYDVWAHTENMSIYSVTHGSIGTYQPGLKTEGRDLWSYKNEVPNNVWDYLLNEVINKTYYTDEGKEVKIFSAGIDTGHYAHFAYGFIDQYPIRVLGLKGKGEDKFVKYTHDLPTYKPARERANLYLLESDILKDELSDMIMARWTEGTPQPSGFMNFPISSMGQYTTAYFKQYEAETKVLEQNDDGDAIGWRWVKRTQTAQNHFFDCAYYNLAVRNIVVDAILKEAKIKKGTWADFVKLIKPALI